MAEGQLQVSSVLLPYLDEFTINDIPAKVERNRKRIENVLSPIEDWVMKLQSLLVGEKPLKTAVLIVMVNIGFWIIGSMCTRMVAVVAWGTMAVYMIYVWRVQIWPTIRVPPPIDDNEDWTPMHANLLGVPELSQHLAEALVLTRLYIKALRNMRHKRKHAFAVLICILCTLLMIMGHYVSGFTISYVLVNSLMLWPCAVYHKLMPKIYLAVEPVMMKLLYQLRSRVQSKQKDKAKPKRRREQHGNTVETDSETDDRPPVDPQLSAAIARSITDSEDETTSVTREPSLGYNSDLENLEESSHECPIYEDAGVLGSLEPDVSLMPDFENVCEESNTFMLETDFMPSMDDIDRSRLHAPQRLPHHDDTGSETESIPFDEPQASSQAITSMASGLMAGMAASYAQGALSMVSGMMKGASTSDSRTLMQHPQDRIGDASIIPTSTYSQDDSDFEILNKDELDDHS